jgi:hypothetical protein
MIRLIAVANGTKQTCIRYRTHGGSLTRAAFLSARNDVLANVAIIGAGLLTAYAASAWPDLIVGLGIFFMNLDAAWEVYVAARREVKQRAVGVPPRVTRRKAGFIWPAPLEEGTDSLMTEIWQLAALWLATRGRCGPKFRSLSLGGFKSKRAWSQGHHLQLTAPPQSDRVTMIRHVEWCAPDRPARCDSLPHRMQGLAKASSGTQHFRCRHLQFNCTPARIAHS